MQSQSSVKVIGGSDPVGNQELVQVPRMMPATPAGSVQNMGFPSPTALPEPYPWANLPQYVQSRSVYPQPRVAIPVVGGEVAVKDDAGEDTPEDMPSSDAGLFGGLMGPVNSALESAQKPPTPPSSGSSETTTAPAAEPEGADYGGGGDAPAAKDVGASSYVNGKKVAGYEINTDKARP